MAASQQADAIKPNEQSKVEPIAEEENKSEESTVISTALSKAVTEEESKDKGQEAEFVEEEVVLANLSTEELI